MDGCGAHSPWWVAQWVSAFELALSTVQYVRSCDSCRVGDFFLLLDSLRLRGELDVVGEMGNRRYLVALQWRFCRIRLTV